VKVVENRVHLDVHAGGGRGEPWEVRWPEVTEAVKRLMAAGASVIHEDVRDGVPAHVVMPDPEGNELDVPYRARRGSGGRVCGLANVRWWVQVIHWRPSMSSRAASRWPA
jgi:hypothetical protein